MSADIQIHELTGAGSGVNKTSGTVRFKSVVSTAVDTSNALTIPSSGTTYSYLKELQFNFNTAPTTNIQNLKAYSGGVNFGTGVTLNYDTTNAYGAPFNTDLGGTDFFTKLSGSPIALDSINTGPFTGTGYKGDVLRLQLAVISTATAGLLSAKTATFTYDEA